MLKRSKRSWRMGAALIFNSAEAPVQSRKSLVQLERKSQRFRPRPLQAQRETFALAVICTCNIHCTNVWSTIF